MKDIDVLCVGLAVVNFPVFPVDESLFSRDITRVEAITLLPGGDAVNQSIVLSRLGAKTALCCKRGNDGFGKGLLDLLNEFGDSIDVTGVIVDEKAATGVSVMMIRPDGQRHFCVHRGAMNNFRIENIDLALIARAKVFSYTGMCSMPSIDTDSGVVFKAAQEAGTVTVADTKFVPAGLDTDAIMRQLAYVDYFFPSYDEAAALTGEKEPSRIAKILLETGVKHVGIKMGADGCYFTDGKTEFYLPAIPADVVDTTGAGDNFMSAFIAGLLRGCSHRVCCMLGIAAGAICVAQVGPCGAVKSFKQVHELMEMNR